MNLFALTPDLASKIQGFSRKYHLGLTTLKSRDNLDGLIVLGDGTPDDWVVTMISHHLNGFKTVGIVKPPGKTGTSTFDLLHNYVVSNGALTNIVFFIDGEESDAKDISDLLEESLKKQHIISDAPVSQNEDKFRLYNCSIPNRQFKVALTINGTNTLPGKKHTIEDHLLLIASDLKLINLPKEIDDPKHLWQDSLSEEIKETVFKELAGNKKLVEVTFPQQIIGLSCLKP